ncbi:MAG: hypothetical protein M1818_005429 [Claussenomyces sp. TS43310]|nr:MAG: hypothetical protein M1818_005429 [Claussenomyces sp. TS43310]
MFSRSTAAGPPSMTARTSRRRPRPVSSESSTSQPKAKRRRSALSDQTFLPSDAALKEVKSLKCAGAVAKREDTTQIRQMPQRGLPMRWKKAKAGERVSGDDGSVILTCNDTYTVSRLPAWPERLHTDGAARQHGAIYSDFGYALNISHTHALVWPYTVNTQSPETFTFALPRPSKYTSDYLPLGSLVSPSSPSAEPGLVVVMPHGRVIHWESVASAATLDLIQQQRNGVELMIPGLMAHETVITIRNAESAGFILGFSTGRIACMGVRDGQGRPAVSVEFLRDPSGLLGKGGIFGSLRNVLSSSGWKGRLAAVKASPSMRSSERIVVSATSKARLHVWNIHRGGPHTLLTEFEASNPIIQALKDTDPTLAGMQDDTFEVLDITFVPGSPNTDNAGTGISYGAADETSLLLLTSIGRRDNLHYALVQVILAPESLEIGFARHLRSYKNLVNDGAISKPKLYLPSPALVAFVVFDGAVIVASVAKRSDSPGAQLFADSQMQPDIFEDVVDFRKDVGVEIVGSGFEEPLSPYHAADDAKNQRHRIKHPAVLVLVKGSGMIRIAVTDPYRLTSNTPQQVTAKSKLEQAVFFGSQDNNPLNFRGSAELQFTAEELAEAALELSHDIISSSTPYIPSLPASVEQNLRRRAAALHDLALHLKLTGAHLHRVTRWKLLWNAEKIAGAALVWDRYDALLQTKPVGKKYGLLNDLVLYIHERYKTQPLPEAGELDRIRHWFINDIYRFQIAIPWAYQVVKHNYQEGQKDHASIMALVSEADDFVIGALGAAFSFRQKNLGLYGLQDEQVESGILIDGYEGLPEFWTSTHFITENVKRQTDLARALATEYWQKTLDEGGPDPKVVSKIRLENVELVDLCCRSTRERYRWLLSRDEESVRNSGVHLRNASIRIREIQIEKLAELRLVDEAIELAETHRVFSSLVKLVVEELERLQQIYDESVAVGGTVVPRAADNQRRASHMQDLIQGYVENYGADFANALYTYYVNRGELYALISDTQGKDGFLSDFLRSHGEFAKVSWINEVTREKDYDRAAKSLLDLGLQRERDVWSKKVELSIGKLARMTGRKYSEAGGLIIPDGGEVELAPVKKQLSLLQIQESIYSHIYPSIRAAIDDNAELQLALEAYGNKGKITDTLFAILTEKLASLIGRRTMNAMDTVDLLTLMGPSSRMEQHSLIDGQEFYYALQALNSGPEDNEEIEEAERLIWRRCMLRDDWRNINDTDMKDDRQVQDRLRRTAIYTTLRACFKNLLTVNEGLFEKSSHFRVISPQDAIGAYTTHLDDRFSGCDASIKDPLLSDMRMEDANLEHHTETCRLQKWFETALDLASQSVAQEANEESESGVAMQEVARELESMEEQIAARSKNTGLNLLRSKPRFKPRPQFLKATGGFGGSVRGI